MRVKNSIVNAMVALIMHGSTIVLGFITQKIFILTLGNELLGLNGLFNNLLSVLSIVELGFGTAIVYHLYKPMAENDKEKIVVLMLFYKKVYYYISGVIFILGIAILPMLPFFVGELSISVNIFVLFVLALLDIVASYTLTYKRSILYADQKLYIINLVHIGYVIVLNIICSLILLFYENFYIYLFVRVILRLAENIILTIVANRKYPYIVNINSRKLDDETKIDIINKVKGLLLHKIGGVLVLSTDNLIISKLFGIVYVGLYSNYYLIINAITGLFEQIFSSITATLGNLLLEEDTSKSYKIYKHILFFNSWIYCFSSVGIIFVLESFICIWIGEEYLLSYDILIILVVNFYIQGMRKTSAKFKDAAGIFFEDRYISLIEASINIFFSIYLGKCIGIVGVFIGTIISSMVLFLYSYPIYVYIRLFKKKYIDYMKDHLKYFFITFIIITISIIISRNIHIEGLFLNFVVRFGIACILPNSIMLCLFNNTNEFKFYYNMIKFKKQC